MCVCMHTYIYKYKCIHTNIEMVIDLCVFMCIYGYKCVCIHICTYVYYLPLSVWNNGTESNEYTEHPNFGFQILSFTKRVKDLGINS